MSEFLRTKGSASRAFLRRKTKIRPFTTISTGWPYTLLAHTVGVELKIVNSFIFKEINNECTIFATVRLVPPEEVLYSTFPLRIFGSFHRENNNGKEFSNN